MPFHEELGKLAGKSPVAKAVGVATRPIRRTVGDPLGASIRRAEGAIKSYFKQGGAAKIITKRISRILEREIKRAMPRP